jgi:hypothetical protein
MKGCRSPTVVIALAVALALAMPTVLGARTRRHAPPRIRALTGISEQGAGFMSDPLFKAIDITHVRLMVPWDAGLQTGYWDAWLQTAHAAGYDVLIALEHDARSQCPDQPCHAPSPSVYARALRALLKRYPWIRELQPWNEPNHQSQPTFRAPRLAAAYYNAARRVCPRCLLVAGGMLDDPFLRSYVTRYVEALRSKPSVWGLNDYYDATYFQTDGMDTMLALTRGSLWLTETGGLVAHLLLPYDPQRAAASIRWLYTSAAKRPRIGRIYMYQWRSVPGVDFDAGLLNADGSPRPSYRVIAAAVGPPDADRVRHRARAGAARGPAGHAQAAAAGRATPPADVSPAAAGDATPGLLRSLEDRVAHLEALLEGLQDSVHRETTRQDRRIGELEARIEPAELGRALSRDARERGL